MKTIEQLSDRFLSKLPLWGLGGLLLLSACTRVDLEDSLKGKIIITDWSKRTAGIEQPAEYTVTINNQALTFNNTTNPLPELSTGMYPIHIYNTPEKISINGTVATVATNNNLVEPLPGWLFTAITQAVYADFKEETITAVMQQQVRLLSMKLKHEGEYAAKIVSVTASLSGVCGAWEFKNNIPMGNAMNVPLTFSKQPDGSWLATVRLLGVIGQQQKLTGTIVFDGGSPTDMTLESDLSVSLTNFNTNKDVPLLLTGEMTEAPSQVGFSASIAKWKSEQNSDATAL